MAKPKKGAEPCIWTTGPQAFKAFATHEGKTESARHIKPLHWYIACRLVIEGGFRPEDITPRPPFYIEAKKPSKGPVRHFLHYDPSKAGSGEQVILGGLKTKNVDVVVNKHHVGPVLAVSCKGVTKAFRNLTNRMEETIGECTNLHITYPAMVVGYFAVLRANRTIEDAKEAPVLDEAETAVAPEQMVDPDVPELPATTEDDVRLEANDIAIDKNGEVAEGIVRFHAALREMTARRGIRDEISRYEAMTLALVEPRGTNAGGILDIFPPSGSPLHLSTFFKTLYQRYEERFVYGAPLLADRGITTRLEWDPDSPAFKHNVPGTGVWPAPDFEPRLAAAAN